jgi:hypothetical protein
MSKVKDDFEQKVQELGSAFDEDFITIPRGEYEQMLSELEDLRNMKRVIESKYDTRWRKGNDFV